VKTGDAKSSVYRAQAPRRQDCQITLPISITCRADASVISIRGSCVGPAAVLFDELQASTRSSALEPEEELNMEVNEDLAGDEQNSACRGYIFSATYSVLPFINDSTSLRE
jgi:hypothetical protein